VKGVTVTSVKKRRKLDGKREKGGGKQAILKKGYGRLKGKGLQGALAR